MPRRFYLPVILSAIVVVADCSFASASPASPDGISATNFTPYVQLTRGGRGGGGRGGGGRYHGGGVHGGYRVGGRYNGGVWYGTGRRYWHGRWYAYGVGSCWR